MKILNTIKTFGATLLASALVPLTSAYSSGLPMINLWDLFVEQLFGNFMIAVIFIALLMFIILMLGGINYFTVTIFLGYFFLAMALGYGYPILSFPIIVGGAIYLIFQVFKFIENR